MDAAEAYRILGISASNVSMADVKDAYRKLARQWHPDRFPDATDKKQAEERFKRINGAYEFLKAHPPIAASTSTAKPAAHSATPNHPNPSTPYPADRERDTKTNPKRHSQTRTHSFRSSTAGELYESAAALGKVGRYEEAIELLGLAIKLSPKYAQAYRYRGFMRSVLGFEMSAEADLRRAKAIEEEWTSPQKTSAKNNSHFHTHRSRKTPDFTSTQYQTTDRNTTDPTSNSTSNSTTTSEPYPEPKSIQLSSVMPPGTPAQSQPWPILATIATPQAQCVTFAHDRNTLVTGDRSGKISLWSLKTQREYVRLERHRQGITQLTLSADGQILISASRDGWVHLWHLSTATMMRSLNAEAGAVFAVWMSGDRRYVMTGGEDGMLRVWQTKDGRLIQRFPQQSSAIWAMAGNAQGNGFATTMTKGLVKSWQLPIGESHPVEAGTIESGLQYPGSAIGFLRDPAVLLCGNVTGVVRAWNESGQSRYTIATHEGMVRSIAVHPLGLQFATAGEDGLVRVWNGSEGRLLAVLSGHRGPVLDLAWNRKGDVLASLGAEGQVKLWRCQ